MLRKRYYRIQTQIANMSICTQKGYGLLSLHPSMPFLSTISLYARCCSNDRCTFNSLASWLNLKLSKVKFSNVFKRLFIILN